MSVLTNDDEDETEDVVLDADDADVVRGKTDSRGRLALGSDRADSEATVLILKTTPKDAEDA
jgi:hypothetical protein